MPRVSPCPPHVSPAAFFFLRCKSRLTGLRALSSTVSSALACTAVALLALCGGCAAPADPTPRHPIVPQAVGDLSVRQLGDAAVLTFTLPSNSTSQDPLLSPQTVEVYRSGLDAAAPAANPKTRRSSQDAGARLVDTIPGAVTKTGEKAGRIEFADPLAPAEIASSPGVELRYFVRTYISPKRPSADSNVVTVHVYPTAAPIGDLKAAVTETAIVLKWAPAAQTASGSPAPAIAGYNVYRGAVAAENSAAAISRPLEGKRLTSMALLGRATAAEYRDESFTMGSAYVYVVRSVAPAGTATVESADSQPVAVLAKDVFPPSAPKALEAVPLAATNGSPASIELVWDIGTEADLAGYVVYRTENAPGGAAQQPEERLNRDLLPVSTFRDMNVTSGKRYSYRVTAVDRSGNESPASTVSAEVPGP